MGSPKELRKLFRYTGDRLPIVSAHRGGAGPGLPENCIATFAETLKHGYAMLEIDPRVTRDGQVVVLHDATLDRTTTGHGPIKEQTLAELKTLRLKDINGDVTDHQIPTLSEVFEWAKGKAILVIDGKDVSIADRVRQIEKHDAESYAMLIAGGVKAAKECYELNPDIMMEVFVPDRQRLDAFEASGVRWSNVIAFVGHEPTKDRELLRRLHQRGVSTIAGTSRNLDRDLARQPGVDEDLESKYRELLDRGIDLIETDLPRRIWPLLYQDVDIPESKRVFLNRRPKPQQQN
ncbi:glycerophosphodiester phosphodiesterase family protein [Stieleria mannarensis]|uniref:glycerophosphodiester phosphodiesterase family protein n=1 Tax=Stieleria mannarensis TaxID=2755585 RepID=UPI0016018123